MKQAASVEPTIEDSVQKLCNLPAEEILLFLDNHAEIVSAEAVERLADIVRQNVRKDVNHALRAGEAACVIAERAGTPACLAPALRAKANALWFKGQCKPAVSLLERAVLLFEELGRLDEVGRTLSTSIQPLILLGAYEQALAAAQRARQLFTAQNDGLRLARLELNVANVYHRQERFVEALESYERAYKKLVKYGDTEAIAVALHNMAVCLISLDDFDRALEVYTQARRFFEEHSMPVLVSQSDYNIAYLYYLRGDYERALSGLAAARQSCEREGDAYHASLCDLDESEIYLDLNLTAEALEAAHRAIRGFEALAMGYEMARASVNAAVAACRNADYDSAITLFRAAKNAFAREEHRAGEALVDLYESVLLIEAGQPSEAKRQCASARDYFAASGLVRKAVVCDLLLARLHYLDRDLDGARAYCDNAIEQLRHLQAPTLAYQALMTAGHLNEALGEEQAAFESYEAARRELESVRCGFVYEELKVAFMSGRCEVYARLVRLCLQNGATGTPAEQALMYIEHAKSRSLFDSVIGVSHPLPALTFADDETEQAANKLRAQLNWYYRRIEREQLLQEGVRPERISLLWEQARACEKRLLDIRQTRPEIRSEHESHAAMEIDINAIRAVLAPKTAIIEYYETGGHTLAAVISSNSLHIIPLAPTREVQSRVRMLLFQLSKFRLGPEYTRRVEGSLTKSVIGHLQALYRNIIEPLRAHLTAVKHLVIVPHGALHYVPIHALHDGDGYVTDTFEVSYSPSARLYAHSCCVETPPTVGSLVMGYYDDKAPWMRQEAVEVARVLPDAKLLLGADATRDALEQIGGACHRIHVATHGFFRRDNPMFSGVRLGDSYLSLYDLYKLRFPVDLFTLSGCATGLNVVGAGDEVMGLARGLLYAGARSLLLTLWDVHDHSTARFMCSFYRHLNGTGNKAASARAAMLELRDEFRHPYYWAPFTLVGRC